VFTCRHQPIVLPLSLAAELAAAYGEPHRAYHDATHVAEVLGWFDTVADDVGWHQPAEVYVAIVFHDAIYVPGANDNELRSAAWARRSDIAVDLDRVGELILLTATHGKYALVDDRDAALFLDCDMAILGAPREAFARYDEAIRAEYSSIPAEHYQAGRRAFLEGLLARDRIFLSDYFHARLDAAARANLTTALQR
jgi:predicted metal-dependent HD superfamily phosphohydrolase